MLQKLTRRWACAAAASFLSVGAARSFRSLQLGGDCDALIQRPSHNLNDALRLGNARGDRGWR